MTQTGARLLGQRFTVWYWAGHRPVPMWARSTKAIEVDLFTATARYKLLSDLGFTVALSWSYPIPGRTAMAAKYPQMYTNPHQKPPFSRITKHRSFPEAFPQGDGAGV